MYFYSDEYIKVVQAIRFYISKFIDKEIINNMNIKDLNIEKIKDNFYNFTYEIYFNDQSSSDIKFISGTISKKLVKILGKRTIYKTKNKKSISFTTIKIGQFVLDNKDINYSDLLATIGTYDDNEKIESTSHRQNYKFKQGKIDLLDNYSNLTATKWPILNHNNHELVKKLQKCWL